MQDLTHRQTKIQQKRKQTSFRDFVMEICSRFPLDLYKNEGLISIFPPNDRTGNIVGLKEYYANYANVLDGNEEIGKNFFEQMQIFFKNHYKSSLVHYTKNENCDYAQWCFGAKNAYLSFITGNIAENVVYSVWSWNDVRNVFNSFLVSDHSENIFHSKMVTNSFNIFYSQYIYNSSDMWFCSNCIGCHSCMECEGLENASYYIKNQPYTKEEYNHIKQAYIPKNYNTLHTQIFSHKGKNFICNDVRGTGMYNCHNIEDGYNLTYFSNSKNIVCSGGIPESYECYDCIDTGVNSSDYYAVCQGGTNNNNAYMCRGFSQGCSNMYYCIFMENCSFCFGCIGLTNRQFCILNKQYTKEERHAKVDEIFLQMEKDGTLGQFFPATMNPFYFNNTAAYLIDPSFTKEEVEAKGYLRRDEPIKVDIPANAELVKTSELNNYEGFDENGKWAINEEILKKVIVDESGNMWRVVNMEYAFLVKYSLPLPRKHWLERMKENFKIG